MKWWSLGQWSSWCPLEVVLAGIASQYLDFTVHENRMDYDDYYYIDGVDFVVDDIIFPLVCAAALLEALEMDCLRRSGSSFHSHTNFPLLSNTAGTWPPSNQSPPFGTGKFNFVCTVENLQLYSVWAHFRISCSYYFGKGTQEKPCQEFHWYKSQQGFSTVDIKLTHHHTYKWTPKKNETHT